MREPVHRIPNMSAAILAGGKSRRMGRNKALLSFRGRPLVARVYETLQPLFEDIFLVTNDPGLFDFVPCPKIPDRVPGKGPISGVDAALRHSRNPYVLAVGCDAPFLSPSLLELLAGKTEEADLVIPCGPHGPEPLCAVYGKGCLPLIEESLQKGDFSLMALVGRLRTREIPAEEVTAVDPGFRSFMNINTPGDFRMLSDYDQ
ncbi:MAG TPA: molybdenum cofactor guanylyltransferase [Candidatus Deferrimicrobiaceae bacterium]|nr:molybdenum cofactor guanylyltransferase [Candidatus Deferrimicrobiaceae bacterium]